MPPNKNLGSKILLPGNSVIKVISWKNKPVFTEIILLHINRTKFNLAKGIINAFDQMEFCLVIKLTMDGNLAIILPPMFATRYDSFASTFYTR